MTDHDKKISGVEAPMNSVQQQAGPSEGRRRLMKGALAAPAVMTLMNGRLAAAASMTCDLKAGDPGVGWVDAAGNELELGKDAEGNDALGYYDGDDFVPSEPYAPSNSCLNSLHPSSNV